MATHYWVFTHRELPIPSGAAVTLTQGRVSEVHAAMTAAAGEKDLWVIGGGDLAGQFADAGLLDEVWIQFAPVTLGSGAPLLPRALDLELIEVARNRDFSCGRYRVITPRQEQAPGSSLDWWHGRIHQGARHRQRLHHHRRS